LQINGAYFELKIEAVIHMSFRCSCGNKNNIQIIIKILKLIKAKVYSTMKLSKYIVIIVPENKFYFLFFSFYA